ncbi:MAG: glycoside hydrolase N-terminal domain-containing protein [Kiritimatiellia bacterium]
MSARPPPPPPPPLHHLRQRHLPRPRQLGPRRLHRRAPPGPFSTASRASPSPAADRPSPSRSPPAATRHLRITFAKPADDTRFQLPLRHRLRRRHPRHRRPASAAPADYRRSLDLTTGVALTDNVNGAKIRQEVLASHPDQVIVVHLSADKDHALSCRVRLKDAHGREISAGGDSLLAAGQLGNGLRFASMVRAVQHGGTSPTRTASCSRAAPATLVLAARTDYAMDYAKGWRSGQDPGPRVAAETKAALAKPAARLLADHIREHQGLFGRLSIDLGTTAPDVLALSTRAPQAARRGQG